MDAKKKIVISLVVFTLLFYMNVNLRQVTTSKINEYYDILNERLPDSVINSLQTRKGSERPDKPLKHNGETEYYAQTSQGATKSDFQASITHTNTPDEAIPYKNNAPVVFPSLTNCSRQDYKRKLENGKRFHSRAHVYVCRKWRQPNPRKTLWPMVIKPTNGSVLKSLSINHKDPKVESLLKEQAAVQSERVSRLADTCLRHPELAIRQTFKLVWDTSRTPPLIYCPIYKVASTTWSVYLLRLAHIRTNKRNKNNKTRDVHTLMSEQYRPPDDDEERNTLFPKSLRFITVRHPFDRVLSAYRDKIDDETPKPFQPYFLDLQHAIIKKYRSPNSNNTSPTPTFPEFVEYVIDSTENFTTVKDWVENVVCWTPYWVQCGVCSSDFQVVVKLETMDTDVQFLAEVAQLKEIQNEQVWMHQSENDGLSSIARPEYFKQLTKRQMRLLYLRYKLDFDLFGYDIDDYLKYGKT